MSVKFNNVIMRSAIVNGGTPVPTTTSAPGGIGGSISFDGSTYLQVPASSDWAIGTDDFTVEWFINQSDTNNWPRVFTFGPHPSYFGVSIEEGTFYFWSGGSVAASMDTTYGTWNHMAVTRESTVVRLFVNGEMGAEISYSDNYTLTGLPLTIGVDPGNIEPTLITCNLTNFNYVVGEAKYTSTFTPPTTPIAASSGTKLLLLASNSSGLLTDSSTYGRTVNVVTGTPTWSSSNPF